MSNEVAPEYETEEVAFRKDGTIILRIEDQRSVLRRPKFKELRVLREEIASLGTQFREEREPLVKRLEALAGEPTGDEAVEDTAARLLEAQASPEWLEIQDALRVVRDDSDRQTLTWFRDSILGRFAKPVPVIEDPEDLPPWVVDQEFISSLLTHWSTVPRRPGVA